MNKDNEIRREIQSKFSDYRVPLPPGGWERIEQSLNAARAARLAVRRRWYAASAAAAVILLVGGLLFIKPLDNGTTPLVSESESLASSAESRQGQVNASRQADATTAIPDGSLYTSAHKKQKKSGLNVYTTPEKIESMLKRGRSLQVKVEKNINKKDLSSVVRQIERQPVGDVTDDAGEAYFITIGGEKTGLIKEEQARRNEGRIVLAMNGRGGLTPFQQTVNSPMTLRAAQFDENNPPRVESKLMLTSNNTAGNVSEMEHDQPVSFGITVSKPLFDDLSLETGILYTYLSSKARNTGTNFQVRETQHLHYLGVPLNVNYNLFSLKKLDVYASVGGMLEKDVYGEYRRTGEGRSTELDISSEEREITKISQRNPQLSINAGVGISYPVFQNLKLYGKIGGAYYFDANNQYKTIYSDSKIVMDLNVGLRYEFK